MSMGHAPCWAHVVEEDFVREHAGKELEELQLFLEEHESDLPDFMREMAHEATPDSMEILDGETAEEVDGKCLKLWDALQEKFTQSTGGLTLNTAYNDEPEKYDEVRGEVWCVGGVYDLTEAGKKYEKRINLFAGWCDFG